MTEKKSCGSVFQTILLIILVLLSSFQMAFIMGLTPNFHKTDDNKSQGLENVVRNALLEHEYSKVGGKDNYDIITELQKIYLTYEGNAMNINAQKEALNQLKSGTLPTEESKPEVTANPSAATLTTEQRQALLSGAVIEGNKDADIVVIEYSDLECPYCLQHVNVNQVTKNLKAEFGDKLAFIFKNHFGVEHRGTRKKAYGTICAYRVGGAEKYTEFYSKLFAYSAENEGYYPVSKLSEYAKEIGLDVAKWEACLEDTSVVAQFESERAEAMSYGLSGTPGVLLFNQKTGKYTTISGAYPYENFQAAVKSLLQ